MRGSVGSVNGAVGRGEGLRDDGRSLAALALVTLVFLFFLQAQRAYLASLFALVYDAVFPSFSPVGLAAAALPLAVLAAPLAPLAYRLGHGRTLVGAGSLAAAARVVMVPAGLGPRLVGSSVVVAGAGLFVAHAVGVLDRRAVGGGAALAVTIDGLLRLAGWSYDPSLRPGWLVVQVVLSGVTIALAVVVARNGGLVRDSALVRNGDLVRDAVRAREPARAPSTARAPHASGAATADLERRAGGLRLRGALMLGAILFFETSVVGSAPVGAAWTGVGYPLLAVLLVVSGGVAAALLLALREPAGRHAPAAAGLAVAVVGGALAGWGWEGWGAAAAFVGAHIAALLLLGRALAPAGGRRGGWTVTVALAVFLLFSILYAFTYFYAFTFQSFQGAAPRILVLAGAVLFAATLLVPLPRPTPPPAVRPRVVAAALATLTVAAAVPAWIGWRAEVEAEKADTLAGWAERLIAQADDPGTSSSGFGAGSEVSGAGGFAPTPTGTRALDVRVATYNVHFGFGEDWRYAPEAMAATIAESGADVVALQEVSVSLASAYGTDLARWLGRRLGMRVRFAPTVNGTLGDAVLSRLPVVAFRSVPLPPADADRKQVAIAEIAVGPDTVRFLATHFGLTPEEQAVQTTGVLEAAGTGPAILAGDLNAGPESDVARRLGEAGFRDAFELAGALPAPTSPAIMPRERIDWIWLRGYGAVEARVLDSTVSDHRLVVTRVRIAEALNGGGRAARTSAAREAPVTQE